MSREESAAKAMGDTTPKRIKYGEDLEEWVDRVMPDALRAADAWDAANGVYRVNMDDTTVERIAKAMWIADTDAPLGFWGNLMDTERDYYRNLVRAVLAAAVKEGQ